MYLQVAVLSLVNTTPELKEISRDYYKRLGKTLYDPNDIDYVARIMYTKHIVHNKHWLTVYETKFLADYLVGQDTPELIELDTLITKCGGWLKFIKLLQLYAKRRLLKILLRFPRNEELVNSGKKLVDKVNGIPKDGRCH